MCKHSCVRVCFLFGLVDFPIRTIQRSHRIRIGYYPISQLVALSKEYFFQIPRGRPLTSSLAQYSMYFREVISSKSGTLSKQDRIVAGRGPAVYYHTNYGRVLLQYVLG
jgi:hypothetical protein